MRAESERAGSERRTGRGADPDSAVSPPAEAPLLVSLAPPAPRRCVTAPVAPLLAAEAAAPVARERISSAPSALSSSESVVPGCGTAT